MEPKVEWVGKQFKHYANNRIYTITDITVTTSVVTGAVVGYTYHAESTTMGQVVPGSVPKSLIDRSILRHGWVEAA